MATITELTRVLQFGDSILPIGAFSFSNGLESAVQAGVVHDVETLRTFVLAAVEQSANADGLALLAAHRAATAGDVAGIDRADHAVIERKLNQETRTMTVRMGRKLAEMAGRVLDGSATADWLGRVRSGTTPGSLPVGQALVFADLGLPEHDAFAVHQYGLACMMTTASLRLMRIHHLDTQEILFDVSGRVEAAYERAAELGLDDMYTFAPEYDVLASLHVQAHVRMFMN